MPAFTWLTWLQARQALAARLADPNNVFWTDAENKLYLTEALRVWNSLTEQFNTDFAFPATPPTVWYNFGTLIGSPRLRTVTDADLYTVMQYHLLEPPTGAGAWTGTSQFSLADLQYALQRRRDEVIQAVACNIDELPKLPSTPNVRRTFFPDSTLEPIRTRFVPDSGSATTLSREDTIAFDAFESQHLQQNQTPSAWSVITGPPLAMDVDTAPNVAGVYDVLYLRSGLTFNPPAATLMGLPDDWTWIAKWGALADLLSRDSEATDRDRADYCLNRFMQGLKIMQASNWLVSATINGVPVDTPALRDMDGFVPEWQDNASAWPSLVTAGIDFAGVCPVPAVLSGVSTIVIGNAPIPILDGDFVQVSRDVFDAILDYAQVLASFKQGGAEFKSTADLEKNFFTVAMQTNKRLADLGLFRDVAGLEGKRQQKAVPRG